jgi:hypothetical protein
MSRSPSFDVNEALQSPATVFAKPSDVVNHPGLNVETKFKVLDQWERDARALAVAEEEGMSGGEENMLGRVRRAIRELNARADPQAHPLGPGSKFGP